MSKRQEAAAHIYGGQVDRSGRVEPGGYKADELGDAYEGPMPSAGDNEPIVDDSTRPFPVEALPEAVGRFVVEQSGAIGCDPAAVALPALAALGGMIGCKRQIAIKPGRGGWYESPQIWAVVVGRSGSTKSPAWAAAVEPVRDLERELYEDYVRDLAAHEARSLVEKLNEGDDDDPEPVRRRVLAADVTVEKLAVILQENPAGILIARDELSGWVESFNQYKARGGSDLANWLEMHRAGPVIVDRKYGGSVYVPHAAVSVCGTIQPRVLRSVMHERNRAAGLAARLLLAKLPKSPRVWSEATVAPATFDAYAAVVKGLFNLARYDKPVSVPMSADAKRLFIGFFNEWNREAADLDDDLAAAFAKLEAYAPRFALIHHLTMTFSDVAPAPVGPDSMAAGITLARWFGREAERIYAELDADDLDDRAALVAFIRSRGGRVTVRDLMRWNHRRYPAADLAEAALQGLVRDRLGSFVVPISTGPGRPSAVFVMGDK